MEIFKSTDKEIIFSKLQLSITLILILFLTVTGATYAYLYATDTDINTITGNMATVNLTLDVAKVFPTSSSENTGVMIPQLSTSGSNTSALSTALKRGCVDANGNIVCQVYKVTVKNAGGTATLVTDGTVSFYSDTALTANIHDTMPNLKWKLITSADSSTPTNSVLGTNADLEANSNKNVFANDVTLATNNTKVYYMIVWLNETRNLQSSDAGKTFYGLIAFNSSNGTGVTATFSSYS